MFNNVKQWRLSLAWQRLQEVFIWDMQWYIITVLEKVIYFQSFRSALNDSLDEHNDKSSQVNVPMISILFSTLH